MNAGRRTLLVLAVAAVVIGFANFLWFMAESSQTGGQGYERENHYYLNNHGSITEVSKATYEWVTLHGISIFVTHPIALAGMAYLVFTVGFPSMVRGSADPRRAARIDAIRNSGPVLASRRCAGRIDSLRLTTPLIRVEVRPGGVLIEPLGMAAIGVDAGEIVGVVPDPSFLVTYLQIVHGQAATPAIGLWLRSDDAVVSAIRSIAAASPGSLTRSLSAVTKPNAEPYSTETKAVLLVMFGLAILFGVVATQFIPVPGGFGDLWTMGVVGIMVANGWLYFVRNRDRW